MSAAPSLSKLRGSRVVKGTTRSETPGASVCNNRAMGPINSAAVASAKAKMKVRAVSWGTNRLGTMASCSCRRESRTLGHKARAYGVGAMPWPCRRTSSSPSVSRKRRKALLTAGWVKDRLCAALVRLRSAITSSNTRSKFRSSVRKEAGRVGRRGPFVIHHHYE